ITRLAQEQGGELCLDLVRHAFATMLRHGLPRASVMQELDALLPELGELQVIDELHHLAETRIHVALLPPPLAPPAQRSLPEVMILALRDRHVELVLHPRLDGAEHAALAFQRVVLRQGQPAAQDTAPPAGGPPAPVRPT